MNSKSTAARAPNAALGTPPPKRRRSSADQSARARTGNRAEDIVEELHAVCSASSVAWIRKLPTPMRPLGRGRAVFVAKSGVDYMGHHADGRAVYVEAKKCDDARFYLSKIPEHQSAELSIANAHGCIAVLLVILGGDAFAVPWWLARTTKRIDREWLASMDIGATTARDRAYLSAGSVAMQPDPMHVSPFDRAVRDAMVEAAKGAE